MQNNFVVPSRKIHHTILSHRALASSVGINTLCLASRHGASSYPSTAFSKFTSNNCKLALERETKATRSHCLKLAFFMPTLAAYISEVFIYCSKRASHLLDKILCSWEMREELLYTLDAEAVGFFFRLPDHKQKHGDLLTMEARPKLRPVSLTLIT